MESKRAFKRTVSFSFQDPEEEVEIVRWMYRMFIEERIVESKLADILNERGITTDLGRPWTRGTVHQVLTSEKYIGNNVYNRVSFKLKKKRVVNSPEMWIRSNAVFQPIVPGICLLRPKSSFVSAVESIQTKNCWISFALIETRRSALRSSDR